MASLNLSCVPRYPDLLWAQTENSHRSYNLFNNGVVEKLKIRRCDAGVSDVLGQEDLDDRVLEHIRNAGFEGIYMAVVNQIDHHLIQALVERWRPETNTFHFPIGEATVTLQDVQVIWGLPIDGPAVSGEWITDNENSELWNNMCQNMLGFIPDEEDKLKGSKIKIDALVREIIRPYDNNDDVACEQRARTIILAMLASQIFVDSSTHDVSLNYLQNLQDLSIEGRKGWGAAVIANLYRNLSKATNPNRKGIEGPLLLLQYWAWERMKRIAPRVFHYRDHGPYNYQTVLANRWHGSMSHTDTPAHVVSVYRSFFNALTNDQFNWTPYQNILHRLPEECRDGQHIWSYSGPLVFWNEVEPHLPHRVARQFGFIQTIPPPVGLLTAHEHARLQNMRKGGRGAISWSNRHGQFIAEWNNRHNRVWNGVAGDTTADGYMQWYHERTILCVTRPGHDIPPTEYPAWGAEQQMAYEGLREVDQRARQFQESYPAQSQLFEDIRTVPREVFEYNHNIDRMHYSSQNIQFPPGTFYPTPPPGAGGYHPTPRAPTGGYYPDSSWAGPSTSGQPSFRYPAPNMAYITPTQNYPLFNASPSVFQPDLPMHHPFPQPRHNTPIRMQGYDMPNTSRYPVTELGKDEDDDEVEEEEPVMQRPRRANRGRPPCGTGGHR